MRSSPYFESQLFFTLHIYSYCFTQLAASRLLRNFKNKKTLYNIAKRPKYPYPFEPRHLSPTRANPGLRDSREQGRRLASCSPCGGGAWPVRLLQGRQQWRARQGSGSGGSAEARGAEVRHRGRERRQGTRRHASR